MTEVHITDDEGRQFVLTFPSREKGENFLRELGGADNVESAYMTADGRWVDVENWDIPDCESLSGWEVAKLLGCGYTGDGNAVQGGGMFYDERDWPNWGYAHVVEFWIDEDNGALVVEKGTVNRAKDMRAAFACIGVSDPNDMNSAAAAIEASRAYYGYESDDLLQFDLQGVEGDEQHVWEEVWVWLQELRG